MLYLIGMLLVVGIALVSNDGKWFPYLNAVGLGLVYLGMVLAKKYKECFSN